jgi:hypothetical protein
MEIGLSSPESRARRGAGLLMAMVSAAAFGSSGTFGSALLVTGWSPVAVVLARIVVAALALTPPALVQLRGRWGQLRHSAGMVIAHGLIGVVGCQRRRGRRDRWPDDDDDRADRIRRDQRHRPHVGHAERC